MSSPDNPKPNLTDATLEPLLQADHGGKSEAGRGALQSTLGPWSPASSFLAVNTSVGIGVGRLLQTVLVGQEEPSTGKYFVSLQES